MPDIPHYLTSFFTVGPNGILTRNTHKIIITKRMTRFLGPQILGPNLKTSICNNDIFLLIEINMHNAYYQISYINRTLVGDEIVDHSDVVGASPVGAAPTTSSSRLNSVKHLATIDWAEKTARWDKKHLSVVIYARGMTVYNSSHT